LTLWNGLAHYVGCITQLALTGSPDALSNGLAHYVGCITQLALTGSPDALSNGLAHYVGCITQLALTGSPDALSNVMGRGLTISNYTTLTFAQWVTGQNQPSATYSHWFAITVNIALFEVGHMHLLETSFQRVALGCSYCLLSRWAFSTFVLSTTQKSSGFEHCPL
jgi:hypothetical protein